MRGRRGRVRARLGADEALWGIRHAEGLDGQLLRPAATAAATTAAARSAGGVATGLLELLDRCAAPLPVRPSGLRQLLGLEAGAGSSGLHGGYAAAHLP